MRTHIIHIYVDASPFEHCLNGHFSTSSSEFVQPGTVDVQKRFLLSCFPHILVHLDHSVLLSYLHSTINRNQLRSEKNEEIITDKQKKPGFMVENE